MAWETTAEAPPAAWPWAQELADAYQEGWVPPPAPPDEIDACRRIHDVIRAHDGAGLDRKTVLDFGCGRGACLAEAARLGASDLIAVDLDPDAVLLARETCKPYRASFTGIRETAGLPDGSAQVVWSHGVVEHIRPDGIVAYLREAARLSSCWVAISAPNPRNGPYQEFRRNHLELESWIYGYEEPLPDYGPSFEAAGIDVVESGEAATTEELALVYARQLGLRLDHWRNEWAEERVAGAVTYTIGRVRGRRP